MEVRAGGIGRQIEEAKHARQRGVEIRYPVVEAQRQYRQRQRRLPMLHHPDLLADHPAEIGQIVGVAVRAVETEGEDRVADVARIAHAMDDPGAGEEHRDQPDVLEVGRHLVDDAGLARCQRAQLLQVGLRFRVERGAVERGDAGGGLRGLAAAEPPGELAEGRTLAGGMGLGVRADDLLGERGA